MHLDQVTRIVLVQSHALVRQGMVRVLESFEGLRVVGDAGTVENAIDLVGRFKPEIVVIDAELRGANSLALLERIREDHPRVRIVVVSEGASQQHVEQALRLGAEGYTLKDVSTDEFADTIRSVAAGETSLHPKVAVALASGLAAGAHGQGSAVQLTPRQQEILNLLAMGLENKQIARRLGIGIHTVKTHVSRVLAKLGASSRTEAVVMAMRDRLLG